MTAMARPLDPIFHALGNATRRAVMEHLGRGPATVSDLAAPFKMALPSFLQHLKVLEDCGLVRSKKAGRVRTVHLRTSEFDRAADWLATQRRIWERRLDQLDAYAATMEHNDGNPDNDQT